MLAADSLHTVKLPTFTQPRPDLSSKSSSTPATPAGIASKWLASFASALSSSDLGASLPTVLHADCWWRDHLALGWDLRTVRGINSLHDYLSAAQPRLQLRPTALAESGHFVPSTKTPIEGLEWVESMFYWETSIGKGKGMLRLVQDENGAWKAYMLYTALQELKGFEERIGARRPHGGNNSLAGGVSQGNWLERRQRQLEFLDEEPQVVCVGAGQAGLNLAARLQALGVSCLLIDRNKRVGDNWRSRYRTLVTHDPVQYSHMAYMPFPCTWPLFTPKDKLGDWFEAYATLLEINVWLSSTITTSTYSDTTHTWTITVDRANAAPRTLRPRHIVWCTGHSGEPKIPTFPNQSTFAGTVYHGSQHVDATRNTDLAALVSKHVVVIGTGNSGHDIAQNYHDAGAASVTMVQRRGTYVISAAEGKGLFAMHKGLYDDFGPPTDDADVYAQSLPMAVQFALHVPFTKMLREDLEKENLDGLAKAGFQVDFGHDGSGLFRKYMTRGGGYYIDVGCSKLIAEGKIKVAHSPDGIKGFEKDALVLADGRRLQADIVVLATGYDNMRTSVEKALGKEHAERCRDVWDLDQEGELNAMWRPSGHPGLWFMGGNLALCRIYSKFLALQIKAVEEGLNA
ncbi:Flavin-containing monooxygenase-like protein [Macrophomina phaseolina MS6]|uniref:Flavin-containing monooxygenase-like protein n=1 Tax=Macrophomina phaseolina (strain MS6) TaxID=1126212 RepID=K2RE98_MACPH|nr:Flavin-containing monooxygenase-like protein [Macrophomina phaseolina MS6]